jgi:hypothetical protein
MGAISYHIYHFTDVPVTNRPHESIYFLGRWYFYWVLFNYSMWPRNRPPGNSGGIFLYTHGGKSVTLTLNRFFSTPE